MQPYQEEYIANLKELSAFSTLQKQIGRDFETCLAMQRQLKARQRQIVARNMELLRRNLFPLLDRLFDAAPQELDSLTEFAGALLGVQHELDAGLSRQIHRALLNRARQLKDRNGMIRELYWLGMGYNSLCSKLVGLDWADTGDYMSRMRMCFMEAAAYLKYFDEIEDDETRSYILRSRANVALGQFKSSSDKIHMVKRTLEILQDKWYRDKAPDLPWDRYLSMTHRQMAASISRSKEKSMTPQDIADVMESVYIIYEKQLEEAKSLGRQPSARISFSYASINYYCGLDTLDGLLRKTELLIDASDSSSYSADGLFRMVSLPAFYCNFLLEYPEKIAERAEYIDSLYGRAIAYARSFPQSQETETLFFYLCQMMIAFVETPSGITYGDFVLRLLVRFAPEIYAHSYTVGRVASVLCGVLLEEEPGFFDDIDWIRGIADSRQKTGKVQEYAMKGGLFHDMGKLNFTTLYARTARQWFDEEYGLARLHTVIGAQRLSKRPSTERYASIALGHHAWYDGSKGYPDSYVRLECPSRLMVDVIALIDWLDNVTEAACLRTGMRMTFDEAIQTAIDLEGKRFSPLLTQRLRDCSVKERLEKAFQESRRLAVLRLFEAGSNESGDSAAK